MKKLHVTEAVGLKLCHDITKIEPGKFKGRAFQRGHVIRPEDIRELLQLGKEYIYVWQEEAGMVHEDEAAIRIAEAVAGSNLIWDKPQEGKSMLTSEIEGLFKINSPLLRQINAMENITITTRKNNYPAEKGDKLAGAKIIPLVIEEEKIKSIEKLCRDNGPVFVVKPYCQLKYGLIITGNEVYKGRIQDKFAPIVKQKLECFDTVALGEVICPDDITEIEKAIALFKEQQADIIMLTGGMSVDPDDLTPGAIKRSGAEIVTYGAPVQPGNMFMFGYLNHSAIMGIPGGALFRRTTILDVVLHRVFAGEILTKEDFTGMAEGGLCNGCETCRYPNCYFCCQ